MAILTDGELITTPPSSIEKVKGEWLQLCHMEGGPAEYSLLPVQLNTITQKLDWISDDTGAPYSPKGDAVWTAFDVTKNCASSANNNGGDKVDSGIYLFRGGRFKTGPLKSPFKGGFGKVMEFNGHSYVISEVMTKDSCSTKVYSDELLEGQTLKVVDEYSACGMVLEWAGDLDNDGKLDFIFSYAEKPEGYVHDTFLFLSSTRASGELLGLAASFNDNPNAGGITNPSPQRGDP